MIKGYTKRYAGKTHHFTEQQLAERDALMRHVGSYCATCREALRCPTCGRLSPENIWTRNEIIRKANI